MAQPTPSLKPTRPAAFEWPEQLVLCYLDCQARRIFGDIAERDRQYDVEAFLEAYRSMKPKYALQNPSFNNINIAQQSLKYVIRRYFGGQFSLFDVWTVTLTFIQDQNQLVISNSRKQRMPQFSEHTFNLQQIGFGKQLFLLLDAVTYTV
jgi:hypothetical protein